MRPSTILQHGLLSLLAGRTLAEEALNATIAASSAAALGINCRGSGYCDYFTDYTSRELWKVIENRIDPNRWYNDGQQVACAGYEQLTAAGKAWWLSTGLWYSGVCAFLQNTGGWQGKKFQELAGYIVLHECDVCGSVPTDYPAGNDVSKGELTFNFVTNSCSRKDSTDVCY
ncbi:kp4 domain-containing protein [Purpureocillium lilacinum]|uniref:Kp4 domain-containing protein n=1 Tax=Purpureocillium lilacinum TaxID=33203 RepID=A0A179H9S4_PURLI|nr:kp4 domain-containing protein [Purpureocillium lilacinum]OAQ86179.1 kp4 domain-containing protein [Purpureocillium lilacinum]OAQ94137.1 kp4 domain-containing protein [Purpureocillium lilacinum]